MAISASVGHKGINKPLDVETVQKLINKALSDYPRFKNKQQALKVDRDCGDNTKTAIGLFQEIVLNFKHPDKLISPGKTTWKALNKNTTNTQQLNACAALKKPEMLNFTTWFSFDVTDIFISTANKYYDEMSSLLESDDKPAPAKPAKQVTAFRQGDKRWGKEKLGNSKTGSIHGYGCALTSLTMAATYLGSSTKHWDKNLTPKQLTPLVANNIFKKANVFSANSYMLYITGGAKALGMTGKDSGIGKKISSSARTTIDQQLTNGGLVLAHVDYKKSWKGDHWILITQRTSEGSYKAIDPAYGKTLTLYTAPDAGITTSKHAILYGRGSSFSTAIPDKVKDKVKQYKVVRYVTLSAGDAK